MVFAGRDGTPSDSMFITLLIVSRINKHFPPYIRLSKYKLGDNTESGSCIHLYQANLLKQIFVYINIYEKKFSLIAIKQKNV